MYQITKLGMIKRLTDGVVIPADPRNMDHVEYLAWVAAGNTAEHEPDPPLTQEVYAAAIEAHIDETAKAKAYGGTVSLASYVNSTIPEWKAEAETFVAWRDTVWAYAYAQMALVIGGQRPAPTVAEIISELPAIQWPAPG